jgi:hypothetical protein
VADGIAKYNFISDDKIFAGASAFFANFRRQNLLILKKCSFFRARNWKKN